MPNVVLTIDCEGAHHDRCYTGEYIRVLEEEFVPATWLVHVSMKDPSANTNFYYREFVHKIPNWHELGMKVNFENERGHIDNEKERGHVIRVAKDTLKSHLVKCTSFRAGCFDLQPSDVKYLEDIGIIVDSSIVPDANYKMFTDWKGAPHEPYHSSAEDLKKEGKNHLLHVPVTTFEGNYGYLDAGFETLKPLFVANMGREVICLGMRDYVDSIKDLRETIRYFRAKGAHFTTLTQCASEHYEHHEVLSATVS